MTDPRDEARRILGRQVALAEQVAQRGQTVDPADPTRHMLASEAREWRRNVAEFRAVEASIPKTMSPAMLLALL